MTNGRPRLRKVPPIQSHYLPESNPHRMTSFSILSPLDQPLGRRRLLEDLKKCLANAGLTEFGFAVAFAKTGPLYRLQEAIQKWRSAGKRASGIFGIDHNGGRIRAIFPLFSPPRSSAIVPPEIRGWASGRDVLASRSFPTRVHHGRRRDRRSPALRVFGRIGTLLRAVPACSAARQIPISHLATRVQGYNSARKCGYWRFRLRAIS